MKHLFAIAVLVLAASGWAVGDTASDERELTQLVNDLMRLSSSRTSLSWSGSWPRTTSIIVCTGTSRPGRSTWRIARAGAWISIRSSRMRSKSASTGIPPS